MSAVPISVPCVIVVDDRVGLSASDNECVRYRVEGPSGIRTRRRGPAGDVPAGSWKALVVGEAKARAFWNAPPFLGRCRSRRHRILPRNSRILSRTSPRGSAGAAASAGCTSVAPHCFSLRRDRLTGRTPEQDRSPLPKPEFDMGVLASSAAEQDLLRSYRLHADTSITKPVDFGQVADVIRTIDNVFLHVVRLPHSHHTPS